MKDTQFELLKRYIEDTNTNMNEASMVKIKLMKEQNNILLEIKRALEMIETHTQK